MNELPEIKLSRADGRSRGETKLGGKATFLCGKYSEECCGQPMVLLGQFDELDFPEAELPGRMVACVFICRNCCVITCACSASDHP
jgi:hypothetical protein